jgi:hypothetical protein
MTVYRGNTAHIYIKFGSDDQMELAVCKDVTVEIATGVEAYYSTSSISPSSLIDGPIQIAGKINQAWINIYYVGLIDNIPLNEFTLCLHTDTVELYCYSCKFRKGSINIPQDGFVMEDYEFVAKTVAIVDVVPP